MFLYGQQEVTIDDIVAKVYEQNTESTANTYKLPWIEELNVRSETRDWKLRKQSYSLRLRPVSLGERRASSQLYNSWQQELVYLKLDEVYDQVADIHELWIDQDFISRQIELKKQIVALLSDIEKVNTKQSLIDANKLSLLLAVKSRIAKINNGIILDQKRRDDKLRAISEQVQGDYILEADSIDVKGYIQSAKESLLATNRPYISNSDMLDLQVLRNEMELEKAENNRVLDFVSLEYRGPHDNYLEERVSLGMSFNLPFFNGNQLSIAKIKVEQEQEQYKIEKVKQESLAKLTEIKESIFSNVYEYDSYNKLYSEIEDLIIRWSNDGDKTAGHLTRQIMESLSNEKHKHVIIDLRNMDYFKDEEGKIIYYDTLGEACDVCGMYEFEDAWVCKLIFNHIE